MEKEIVNKTKEEKLEEFLSDIRALVNEYAEVSDTQLNANMMKSLGAVELHAAFNEKKIELSNSIARKTMRRIADYFFSTES